ncbi:MAG: PspC domain-containing protein, partial [Actinomycetota bacterium]|nr:PspC domain-containing protein [Actinomycetota bacterium]
MTNTPETPQENPNQAGGDGSKRRLLRSPSERMLAGVAGGTASYLGVDPTFVRLGFVAASLFGGLGILAYLLMAVIVPEDDGTGSPVEGRRPPTWAIVLLVIAALFILPGPFFGWGDGWFLGIGVLWLGALVLIGAGAYRALRGRWPGQQAQAAPGSSSEATTALQPATGDGAPPR